MSQPQAPDQDVAVAAGAAVGQQVRAAAPLAGADNLAERAVRTLVQWALDLTRRNVAPGANTTLPMKD